MKWNRTSAIFLLTLLGLTFGCEAEDDTERQKNTKELAPRGPENGGVFVHLFEWPWADIAQECENVLGPAGYGAVQVSPPSEHAILRNEPWYERYQPVSYALESRSGSREEFIDMVNRCDAVGVGIYVDAVLNHMTAQSSGIGSNGSKFEKYNYPGLWSEDDFRSPPCDIAGSDYQNNAQGVQECELLGLSDLNTGRDNVRESLADYLASLLEIGVKGFRMDAAKHVAADDWKEIFALLATKTEVKPFVFMEIIGDDSEAVGPSQYLPLEVGIGNGVSITDFRYTGALKELDSASLEQLEDFDSDDGLVPKERAVVFADNHDTQRGDSLSYRDGQAHRLANLYLLAHPYGYPKVMSSFSFQAGSGAADSPPADAQFSTLGAYDAAGPGCVLPLGAQEFDANSLKGLDSGLWVCEHRDPQVLAMIRFRAVSAEAAMTDRWTGDAGQLAFARKGSGFFVLNNSDEEISHRLQTGLPAGEYCNVLLLVDQEGQCEQSIKVAEDGLADVKVSPRSALAAHVELKGAEL